MSTSIQNPQPPTEADWAFQAHSLQRVSRTFALTIPQLGGSLEDTVGNAYLLCRIADTIEDCPTLELEEARSFYESFLAAIAGQSDGKAFGQSLADRVAESMTSDEVDLVAHTDAVLRITHSFSPEDQATLLRCVSTMSKGMEKFQEGLFANGLDDMSHMDDYCYHVAGVVGEMLTELFCHHSKAIAANRSKLEPLSISFGQGLQMTNILKDIWEDKKRDICWLPREVFTRHGCDLSDMLESRGTPEFEAALDEVIGIAHGHLANALDYTLHIPRSERGTRLFCLWALFMAVHTLAAIHARPSFSEGDEVKISRSLVRRIVGFTRLAVRQDWLLRRAFKHAARTLPPPQ